MICDDDEDNDDDVGEEEGTLKLHISLQGFSLPAAVI